MTIYFGENLKRLRKEKDLTQEDLAEVLGVSFQAVSKWERGESYPDITVLPEISAFFKVSIDDLLGINKAENEKEIKKLIEEHDNLTDSRLIYESITNLRNKYPNDFRIELRYMSYLIFFNDANTVQKQTKKVENKSKITAIYNNIQQNCTSDSIRICSKRFYIHFLELLSREENSSTTFEDCEKIIKEMPRMRDGQEMFFNCYPENHPERINIIREAIEEELFLLNNTLSHYFWDECFTLQQRIRATEKSIETLNLIYNDGNYSRMWRVMMYDNGYLGLAYYKSGDNKKAIEYFKKMCQLAIQFDSMDRITVLHSTMFEGKTFDKQTLGTTYIAKMQMKERLTEKYPLSDEFRNTDEFKEIIEMLS